MITPPVEPINSEEAKRQVLEEIEEVADEYELDESDPKLRQLRSLKQEVLANAITPEHGKMELEAHTKELQRRTSAAKVGFGPQPQSIYARRLPADDKYALEGTWVPASQQNAGLTWGSLLDPDGTTTPRPGTTPGFGSGIASLYDGPWNAAQGIGRRELAGAAHSALLVSSAKRLRKSFWSFRKHRACQGPGLLTTQHRARCWSIFSTTIPCLLDCPE